MAILSNAEMRGVFDAWREAGMPSEPRELATMCDRYGCLSDPEYATEARTRKHLAERATYRRNRQGVVTDTPCTSVCLNAEQDVCHCSCGGENHGAGFDAAVIRQLNIKEQQCATF